MTLVSLTIQESHFHKLKELLIVESGVERSAYVLCGKALSKTDPWVKEEHCKFISYKVLPIPEEQIISSSDSHITWKTDSFVQALKIAETENLTVALFHSHTQGFAQFSEQDDRNEPDLVELAQNRNGKETELLSVILTNEGQIIGRLWHNQQSNTPLKMIRVVGESIRLFYRERGNSFSQKAFDRQALAFGNALNQDLSKLRIGVVGCGATGSATAMLLARLGVGHIALFDADLVEETNLNRLHGACKADLMKPKVEVVGKSITDFGLGVQVRTFNTWINNPKCRDALKSCDIVFGCTDDHSGRILLNRFAYYYAIPVIDMGLAIDVSQEEIPKIKALDGRVTVLSPHNICLLCRGVINPDIAYAESLKRENPTEYQRQKQEAYVLGEGNPNPAVVTFTTSVATMAVNEMLHRLQGFRGDDGAIVNRVRKFHLMEDRRQGAKSETSCPICSSSHCWGKGDVEPFLDLVG
jgi:molybdopterin/thiamine biosynthesis adenylyltransferase